MLALMLALVHKHLMLMSYVYRMVSFIILCLLSCPIVL
jgi:hypothetical protein